MLLELKFPVLITDAVLPRHDATKPVMALVDTQVEVEDIDDAHAPLVARMERQRLDDFVQIDEFRHRDGVFYAKIPLDWRTLEDVLRQEVWRPIFFTMAKQIENRANEVLPRGIVKPILRNHDITAEHPKLERLGQAMKMAGDAITQLEAARAEFHARVVETIVAIDGELWVQCPEPMLAVDHYTAYSTELATHDLGKRDPVTNRLPRTPTGLTLYTFTQAEQALVVPKINAPNFRGETKVEVFDPSVFSDEVPIGDIIAQLEDISRGNNVFGQVKARIIEFVNNEADWSWDGAYDQIKFLLSSVFKYPHQIERSILERERDRIDARAISILSGPAVRGLGR
ncbi:hypothetical protein HFO56_39290 [Rhizobium laguerreae]|uniref:hypothetical protein n=1 Tax=Rhizobium laguerreae TaxID=1076926 RepID=UPI001C908107|nr:hypothetical protein [Rhizobium laguerreae]MBY3158346.1 hypothetical protein [Rhizobium laguerreae]